jgi:Arc/MetJ family transcription regulator
MKITTYIDEQLLSRAMRAMKAGSQREVLEAGLRNLLAELERKTFVKEFSRFRLTWTPGKLSRSRE